MNIFFWVVSLASILAISFLSYSQGWPPELTAAYLGIFATISVALHNHNELKKREIEARLFSEKREAYLSFFKLFRKLLDESSDSENKKINDEAPKIMAVEEMKDFRNKLLVWGSEKVIEQYFNFEDTCMDENSTKRFFEFNNFLKAIRKDLGHHSSLATEEFLLLRAILVKEDYDKIVSSQGVGQ